MEFLRYLIRRQPLALAICALAVVSSLGFGIAALTEARHWHRPDKPQPLEPWMSPKFVGMSYGLSRNEIEELFALDDDRKGPPPRMAEIAEQLGLTLPELEAKVRDYIEDRRGNRKVDRDKDGDDDR